MAVATDDNSKFREYAHPERLVSTGWLAGQLAAGDPDGDRDLVVVESDEDVVLYDTGHIPGAVKVDWHLDLNDPVRRDYVNGERSSHTWFVLTHLLGFEKVRNYDGSWTEWGNAVQVPIEVGAT